MQRFEARELLRRGVLSEDDGSYYLSSEDRLMKILGLGTGGRNPTRCWLGKRDSKWCHTYDHAIAETLDECRGGTEVPPVTLDPNEGREIREEKIDEVVDWLTSAFGFPRGRAEGIVACYPRTR